MTQIEDYDQPKYVISIVTRLVGLHPQTLRHYENIGLVTPSRSKGNVRLYSQRDVELLRRISRLTQDLGVNLAGVEVILNMAERIENLQDEMDMLQEELRTTTSYLRQSMRVEILRMIRELGDGNDQRWQEIIREVEKRF